MKLKGTCHKNLNAFPDENLKHATVFNSFVLGNIAITLLLLMLLVLFLSQCQTLHDKKSIQKKENAESPPSKRARRTKTAATERTAKKTSSRNAKAEKKSDKGIEKKTTTSSGKIIRTRFYGAVLIREKVLRNGIPMTRIVISGGAVLQHNNVIIRCPRIELDGGKYGRCRGGVRVIDRKAGLNITAANAIYDRDKQELILSGKPRLRIQKKAKDRAVLITTKILRRDMEAGISELKGDIRIIHEDKFLLGDKGVYRDKDETIILHKYPTLLAKNLYISGETMRYAVREKYALFRKNVFMISREKSGRGGLLRGNQNQTGDVVLPSLESYARARGRLKIKNEKTLKPKGKDEGKKKGPISTLVAADRMRHSFVDQKNPVTLFSGNVHLFQDDLRLVSSVLRIFGKKQDRIIADQGVRIHDLKQNILVKAGRMIYTRQSELVRFDRNPRIEFFDKTGEKTLAVLTGSVIEKDLKRSRTEARGSVRLERNTYVASGEIAVYYEKEGLIVMEGGARMQDGENVIACEQIMIFPDEDRVILRRRISGYILDVK